MVQAMVHVKVVAVVKVVDDRLIDNAPFIPDKIKEDLGEKFYF